MDDVAHVTFRGLTFEAARGTAIAHRRRHGRRDRRLHAAQPRQFGGRRSTGGKGNGVHGCDIYNLGGGGISLSGGDRKTLTPAGHWAANNHIHDYGRWQRMYSAGISLGGVGQRVAHNLIHDAPHMAIGFGGNDHLIEFNEIHDVCRESNDAGAIYSGRDWTMRGTVIRHNFMHHVTGFENRGCVGVYLDDMFCGTEVTGNVFYKVTRAAFIGGGRDVLVANNIFVDCDPALHVDARAMGWAAYRVDTTMKERLQEMPYQEPPWSTRYPEAGQHPRRRAGRAQGQRHRAERLLRRPLGRHPRPGPAVRHAQGQPDGRQPGLRRRGEDELPAPRRLGGLQEAAGVPEDPVRGDRVEAVSVSLESWHHEPNAV